MNNTITLVATRNCGMSDSVITKYNHYINI
jgi:hypothetical protein